MNNWKSATKIQGDTSDWDINSFSSEDNDQHDSKDLDYDLCKYMRPPNPLIEKGSYTHSEVRTVYKLNFIKLPDFMSKNEEEVINENKLNMTEKPLQKDLNFPKNNRTISLTENDNSPRIKFGKTLYQIYPEGDSRLVYRKYKREKYIDIEDRVYASYFIDIDKIIKSDKLAKMQYEDEGNTLQNEEFKTDPNTLIFNSLFESGNLYAAFKISNDEYDLILQNDINSKGNTQWFFFSISNTIKDTIIKFNIVNMMKQDSLFNNGMKPVVYSTLENKKTGIGWHREGSNISYFKNHIIREYQNLPNGYQTYYTLTFSYKLKHDKDTLYFAQCYPYTYSDLNNYLNKLSTDNYYKHLINRKVLCKTLARNNCEYLTLTSNKNIENVDQRYGIFLTARQHPGESLSSYLMEGIINFLISASEEADFLRLHCIFKIIPMLNPDGVIHGNYRTSLSGVDLNRRWKKTNKILYPTIYCAKALIRKFEKEREVQLILDLHGHSRKTNTFIYGCTDPINPVSSRVFPFLLSKVSSTFSFKDSRFTIQKSKESTARVALWRELKLPNIFTLESSFYGYEKEGKYFHYTKQDYLNIGKDICKALYVYLTQIVMGMATLPKELSFKGTKQSPIKPNMMDSFNRINSVDWLEELKTNKELLEWGEKTDDSGSDANPSEDDLLPEEIVKLCPKDATPKKEEKFRSSSNMVISIKKVEKANVGTNTNAIPVDELKKPRPRTSEKPGSKRPSIRRVTMQAPIVDISTVSAINMVDKQTQTEEIYSESNYFEASNEGSFITETQLFSNEKRETTFTQEINIKSDKEPKKHANPSFFPSFVMPINNQPVINLPPQIQLYKILNSEKQNEKTNYLKNNNKSNRQDTPALPNSKKNTLGDFSTKGGPICVGKYKGRKYSTDGDLWIKGKKFEENSKEIKIIEADIDSCFSQYTKNGEKILNISEQSTIYKNMTTPRISNFIKSPATRQTNSRPITVINGDSPREINANKDKDKDKDLPIGSVYIPKSYRSQNSKKSRHSDTSCTNTNTKNNNGGMSRNVPKSFRNSVKIKKQSMMSTKREMDSVHKSMDSQNIINKMNTSGQDLFSKIGLNSNKNIDDSIDYKDNKLSNMLTSLNACKNLLVYKNEGNGARNLVKLKDLAKKTKEKIISPNLKEEILNMTKNNKTDLDINQFTRSPNKFYKDDWQSKFWAFGVYKG